MRSGRLLWLVCLSGMLLCLAAAGASAHPYPHSGVFIEHGYACVAKTDAAIQASVQWCLDRQIEYEFINLAALNSDGTMNPDNYSQLAHYITVGRAYAPTHKFVAYLSGTLSSHVNNPATHQNIADFCKLLFDQYAVDGVNLDFEPFQADNQNYLSLYSTIRNTVGAGRHLSLDTTANLTWSPSFVYQVSTYFDWMMPMFYDTGFGAVAQYNDWVVAGLHHYSDNIAANCQTYPIIAAYRRSRWHDPSVENIQTGTNAVVQALNEGCSIASIGVWWRYEWGASDDAMWQTYWLNRFDPPVADFSGNPTTGAAPLTVLFSDLSTGGPTSWSWTFGDGGTSTAQHPSHVYNSNGTYTVALTAANANGNNTNTKSNYISVGGGGPPQDYTCASATVNTGSLKSGDHTSVHASDNAYLVVGSAKVANKQTAQVSYTYSTGLGSLSSLSVTVEGKVSAGSQAVTIYAYNYGTSSWTSIGTGTFTTTDSTLTPSVSSPASYLSGGTVQVRVKVGGTGSTAFDDSTDLVKITAAP